MRISNVKTRISVQRLPIDVITEPRWFPNREELGDLVSLARTIKAKGDVDVPIKVRLLEDGRYEMVWGKRRLEAAKLAGLTSITCIIESKINDEELLRQHCIENIQRLEKNPIEEAELFTLWKNRFNKSYEEIARTIGVSRDYVYNRVELLRLSPQVIKRLKTIRNATNPSESISLYHARLLLKVKDPELQLHLLEEVIKNKLSVRELDNMIKELGIIRRPLSNKREDSHQYTGRRFKEKIYMDLTYPIYAEGQGNLYPEFVKPSYEAYSWEICRKIKITHKNTHVDCPRFIDEDGKTIGEYPLNKFIGEGTIITLSKNKLEAIYPSDIEATNARINNDDIVIINTNWWRYHGSERYIEHPFITEEVADWLIKKKIKILCIDTPTPDMPLAIRHHIADRPIHQTLLSKDILIVENISNCSIDTLTKRVSVSIIPMYLSELSEVPVRVIASL